MPPTPPVPPPSPAARALTYARAVMLGRPPSTDMPSAGDWATQGRRQRVSRLNTGRCPVNPCQEGRCLRCLARDHMIKACRAPMKCRLCLQGGQHQVSCPVKSPVSPSSAATGLYTCLVGEIQDADQAWSHILNALRKLSPDLENPRLSQAGIWRCLPLRPHEGGLALSPMLDTATTWRWRHQMALPLAYGWGFCSPNGNLPPGDSRGPFSIAHQGAPSKNPPTHLPTPEDCLQRAPDW